MTTSRRLGGVAVVLLLTVAGCGEKESVATATEPQVTRAGPVTLVDGEVLLSCNGRPGWVASTMANGIEPPAPESAITTALSAVSVPGHLRKEWKVLATEGDVMVVALGDWSEEGPARDAMAWTLERDGEGWKASSGGNCWHLAPVLPRGASWVKVSSDAVPTDATELEVGVMERGCASARDPLPHLHEPEFVVDDESITVYWTIEPPGAANCPSNPTARTTMTLPEPLGERRLLDGSRWPPVLITD